MHSLSNNSYFSVGLLNRGKFYELSELSLSEVSLDILISEFLSN